MFKNNIFIYLQDIHNGMYIWDRHLSNALPLEQQDQPSVLPPVLSASFAPLRPIFYHLQKPF